MNKILRDTLSAASTCGLELLKKYDGGKHHVLLFRAPSGTVQRYVLTRGSHRTPRAETNIRAALARLAKI